MLKYILLFILCSSPVMAGAVEEDAIKHVAMATIKQYKIDEGVRRLADIYISEKTRKFVEQAYPYARLIVDKKVDYEWSF
jgi:hypothetical protein